MSLLMGCEFYVGLASGLAWLAWALGKKVVMISGFSAPFVEFQSDNTRIAGVGDCVDCLNDILIYDRAWDEDCFHNRDFSCTKNITPDAVVERLPHYLNENVLDFTTAPILRFSKRQTTFKKFLSHIHEKFQNPTLVEVGTVRRDLEDPDLPGDGNSTSIFAWYVKNYGGNLFACDIPEYSIRACKRTLERQNLMTNKVTLVERDGLSFLRDWGGTSEEYTEFAIIHGLYIDGLDWYDDERGRKSEEFHLEALKIADSYLLYKDSLVMFDDVFDISFTGKGKLAIPYALEHGYKIIHQGYQVVLRKE